MSGIASTQNIFPSFGGVVKAPENRQVVQLGTAGFPLTLGVQDVGTIYSLGAPGAAVVINLPAPSVCPGGFLKFVLRVQNAAGHTISITSPVAGTMKGVGLHTPAGVISAATAADAKATVRFAEQDFPGDFVELTSDGTNWNCFGMSQKAVGLSFP
jgi:hypothetical protein